MECLRQARNQNMAGRNITKNDWLPRRSFSRMPTISSSLMRIVPGIKTFGINNRGASTEKIAEFDKLRPLLDGLSGMELIA